MRKSKRSRTANAFFLGLLILNLVSLSSLTVLVYRFFFLAEVNAFEEKARNSLAEECITAVDDIDMHIQTMLEIPGLYFTENGFGQTLLKAQESSIISSPSEVNEMCAMLLRIQKTYPYLKSMDVYYEGSSIAITDFAHIHEITSVSERETYMPWYDYVLSMNSRSMFIPEGKNYYLSKTPVLTYIYRVRSKSAEMKSIYIALHFNPSVFNLPHIGFDISSCIFSPEGKLLLNNNFGEWQLEEVEQSRYSEGIKDSGGVSIYYKTSGSTGLSYAAFASTSLNFRISADNARLQKNFAILVLSCIVIVLMFTAISYYIYRKYINSFSNDVGLSSKGSLSDTLTTIKDKIETLDSQSRSFKEQTILRAFLLNRADKEEYQTFYDSTDEQYIFAVILEPSAEISSDDISILCTSLGINGRVMFTVFSSPMRIVLVFLLHEPAFDVSLLDQIRAAYQDISIDAGSIYSLRANGFQNSFASAMDVYNYRFMDDTSPILLYDNLALESKKAFGNHIGLLSDIENFILLEQKDTAISLVYRLFEDLRNGGYTVQYIKATLGDLVSSIYGIIVQNHLDMWSLLGYDIRYYSAKRIRTVNEYQGWLEKTISVVSDVLHHLKEQETDDLPVRIERIVEENLDHNISLGLLAEKLNMREDALSRAFPALMGCNYIEYVTERKLRKAVDLLYKGIPVQDISALLGYRSPQYFIRIFKKVYGITPHKFRNSGKKKEKNSEDNINNV